MFMIESKQRPSNIHGLYQCAHKRRVHNALQNAATHCPAMLRQTKSRSSMGSRDERENQRQNEWIKKKLYNHCSMRPWNFRCIWGSKINRIQYLLYTCVVFCLGTQTGYRSGHLSIRTINKRLCRSDFDAFVDRQCTWILRARLFSSTVP